MKKEGKIELLEDGWMERDRKRGVEGKEGNRVSIMYARDGKAGG